ncbi:MAG: VWA domain-containing protein [Bacteroidetes bacterium]|nr:VWA domain-containing protein [Bacteroidota bacterium]
MLYEWFRHIDFAYPIVLSLLAILPFLIWWYVKRSSLIQPTIKVSSVHAFTVSSWKKSFRHLLFVMRLLSLACIIIVLAKPQVRNDEQHTEGEGIDIVLAMDVSGSMLSRDFEPNRLEAAKAVAEEFVRSRPVDRIGLVIFSGESYTQCPITNDRNTLLAQIDGLKSGLLKDGTVIGEGLATAVDRLQQSSAKSKVIILLTDGKEDPPDTRLIDPLTALEIAKAKSVRVYTIGMSAETVAPVTPEEIKKGGVVKGKGNTNFLDEDLLRKIATETGGQYFRARDNSGLKEIYNQIDKLEKSKIEITAYKRFDEKFLPFLVAALAFLFIEVVLRYTLFKRFP